MERTSALKLGQPPPLLKTPSVKHQKEAKGRRGSTNLSKNKDKTEKESEEKTEKNENKTRRWVPDPDKGLPGKPFGWKIYQDSVWFSSNALIGQSALIGWL